MAGWACLSRPADSQTDWPGNPGGSSITAGTRTKHHSLPTAGTLCCEFYTLLMISAYVRILEQALDVLKAIICTPFLYLEFLRTTAGGPARARPYLGRHAHLKDIGPLH
jgi:hypothetical protein